MDILYESSCLQRCFDHAGDIFSAVIDDNIS